MDILGKIMQVKGTGEHKPDFEKFVRAIRSSEPQPVTVGDLFADPTAIGNYFNTRILDYHKFAENPNYKMTLKEMVLSVKTGRKLIQFCMANGWNHIWAFSNIGFTGQLDTVTTDNSGGSRVWVDDNQGPVTNWEQFEKYPWPEDLSQANEMTRQLARIVPEGMKIMVIPGGLFEWTTWLMGLVPFSYALADAPDLVDAVIDKVSYYITKMIEEVLDIPQVGGIFMGDDMGFGSGTLVSPAVLRERFFPRLKTVVDMTHEADKLFCLHSCGNIYAVMDDLIEMGIDAKHSFEDKIKPVEDAYKEYGDKIALIGGVDIDLLANGPTEKIRKRTREILDACAGKGRYILGTGNSVASYIPIPNYVAMVEEAKQWNLDHFDRIW